MTTVDTWKRKDGNVDMKGLRAEMMGSMVGGASVTHSSTVDRISGSSSWLEGNRRRDSDRLGLYYR